VAVGTSKVGGPIPCARPQ